MSVRTRLWIVDGHNAIFAIAPLAGLQRRGQRKLAREGLERLLRPFSEVCGGKLIIVYDGNTELPNPDAVHSDTFEVCFSQPPEVADDRIKFLARNAIEKGQPVTVITNDVRTLERDLPRGTVTLRVEEFLDRHIEPLASEQDTEPDPGAVLPDVSDIEDYFLSHSEEIEARARAGARRRRLESERSWLGRLGLLPQEPVPEQLRRRPPSVSQAALQKQAPSSGGSQTAERADSPEAEAPIETRRQRPAEGGSEDSAARVLQEHLRKQKEIKRARGQRKQRRRLEQMKRQGRRKGKRKARR